MNVEELMTVSRMLMNARMKAGKTPASIIGEITTAKLQTAAGCDYEVADAVLNSWIGITQPTDKFDKAWGSKLKSALEAACQPTTVEDILGGGPTTTVTAPTTGTTKTEVKKIETPKPSNGDLSLESRVKIKYIRACQLRGFGANDGAIKAAATAAGYAVKEGRLKNEPDAIQAWVDKRADRADNESVAYEELRNRGFNIEKFVPHGTDARPTNLEESFIGCEDFKAMAKAIGLVDEEPEKAAVLIANEYGFVRNAEPVATKAPEPVATEADPLG